MTEISAFEPLRHGQVKRAQLPSQIADMIRTEVLSGRLKPGERIRQGEWADRVGASRMPVRDAIARLCTEGVLIQDSKGVATVAELRVEDIADAWRLNAVVAGMAARRAAERVLDEELEELRALERAMEAAIERGDLAEAGRCNWAFHARLNKASRSPRLIALLANFARTLSPASFDLIVDFPHRAPEDHQRLLEALERRDGEAAMAIVEQHVADGFAPTVQALHDKISNAASAP